MAQRRVEIEAISRKGGIDVHSCVLALLAFARQLHAEHEADDNGEEVTKQEDGDA